MNPNQDISFLGLPPLQSSYKTASVAVLPVPYEATVSFTGGTAGGPDAIILASQQVELYDEELKCEPSDVGVATLKPLKLDGVKPSELVSHVAPAVARIIADGKLPLLLGGEHSITPAAIKAVSDAHPDLTVVQLDAHADLRQEYEGGPMSHACAMARVRDYCPVVHAGIRNISIDEAHWADREGFPIFYAKDMRSNPEWMNQALKAIATEKIYITIDIDAFDSSIMPATGTPEPGGMDWYSVTDFLRLLALNKKIVGFDIVELAPSKGLHACDFLAAKLAYKCIGYWQKGRALSSAK